MKTLSDINKISGQYREIKMFVAGYNSCANVNSRPAFEDESLPNGCYLQAFANGLDEAVECYQQAVVDLERKFLRKPTHGR